MKQLLKILPVLLFTLFGVLMVKGDFFLILLVFELLWVLFLYGSMRYLKGKISARWKLMNPIVRKGEDVPILLDISNDSIFPVSDISVELETDAVCFFDPRIQERHGSLPASEVSRFRFGESSRYAGWHSYAIRKITVFDLMNLFSFSVPCDEVISVTVLPEQIPTFLAIQDKTRYFTNEEESTPDRKGDDISEISQIREFQNGDSLQRIHWKLSAKEGVLMTREFGAEIGCSVLMLADLYGFPETGMEERMDAYWDIFWSFCCALVAENCPPYVVWYDEKEQVLRRMKVDSEQSGYELLVEILKARPYAKEYSLEELYLAKYEHESQAVVLSLDADLKLKKDYKEIFAFTEAGHKTELESLCVEI